MAAERGPGTPTATGQSRESDVAVLAAVTGRSAGGGPPSGETGGNGSATASREPAKIIDAAEPAVRDIIKAMVK